MSFYPPKIHERFAAPTHAGRVGDANAQGTSASFLCGSFVKISLLIDEQSSVIETAMFTTNGCGFMVAAAESLAAWLGGRQLVDLRGLREDELHAYIGRDLEEFPEERVQCMTVVFEALRSALAEYRIHLVEEFSGEKALICTCFGVTEDTIVDAIEKNHITEVDEVATICRAGSGCGSCRMLIAELIDTGLLCDAVRGRRGDAEP